MFDTNPINQDSGNGYLKTATDYAFVAKEKVFTPTETSSKIGRAFDAGLTALGCGFEKVGEKIECGVTYIGHCTKVLLVGLVKYGFDAIFKLLIAATGLSVTLAILALLLLSLPLILIGAPAVVAYEKFYNGPKREEQEKKIQTLIDLLSNEQKAEFKAMLKAKIENHLSQDVDFDKEEVEIE